MVTGTRCTRSLATLTALALAGAGTVALSSSSPASAAPGGSLVHGLTTDDRLVTFRVDSRTTSNGVDIGGLRPDEDVVGIDVRPATGQIIGVTQGQLQDRIVSIDPTTGAATVLDTLDVDLLGTDFGVDVNPQSDALRIVSNSGQNLRHAFATGTTTADTGLTYGSGTAPQVTAAAYTDNTAGTTTTRLFDLDAERNTLVRQDPPNAGTLTPVGPLGVDITTGNGFDVDAASGTAYASLRTVTGVSLYTVDLSTGTATLRGALPNAVEDITVGAQRFAVEAATVTEGGTAQVTVRRTGDTADAATVDFATASGSATEGSDFTRTTGTVSFAAGDTSKTISVPTTLLGGLEGEESFTVTLSNVRSEGASSLSPSAATVTVTDAENGSLYALTATNQIRTVPVNNPGAAGTTVQVTVVPGDDLIGIDVRPATGELYGVSLQGRLYVINPTTGVAQPRGNTLNPLPAGTGFGVDFNPVADRLRIVSNNGQNLNVNPVTGDTITETSLSSASGTPAVAGAAYSNNVANATSTTLFDIDTATDALVTQTPPASGVLRPVGALGVPLSATSTVGLDISNLGDNAFAALPAEGATSPSLYRVDTSTGAARLLGAFSTSGGTVEDITLVPATQATASPTPSATGTASPSATPSASATPTATTSPTSTATPPALPVCTGPLSVTTNREFIIPTIPVRVTVTGAAPGALVDLQAYSRPSDEYRSVRTTAADSRGTVVFDVTPGTNTRLFAQCVTREGGSGQAASVSNQRVINVRTALSLSVVRNGTRNYTFQGRILPRRAGQLVTLYRVERDGTRVITSQLKTDSSGTYRFTRRFTGSGTFGFLSRTGQTLTNAAGESTSPQGQRSEAYLESGRGTPRPTAIF